MRLWSLNPSYLDSKGLVALWRETLLAKKVLENKTVGYKFHPQLQRFKNTDNPISYINEYLKAIYFEAERRKFKFDRNKICWSLNADSITVTNKQIEFEFSHLLKKLKIRDKDKFEKLKIKTKLQTHPIFKIVKGGIEEWEIIK